MLSIVFSTAGVTGATVTALDIAACALPMPPHGSASELSDNARPDRASRAARYGHLAALG